MGASSTTFPYTGGVQQYVVPDGVTNVTIEAYGGSGGVSRNVDDAHAGAAGITGTLPVQPGTVLLISVGQARADADGHDRDPAGGWGGLGATGGNGNAASDTLRTGAAGGGATTVQLAAADGSEPVTILVAGGGGGQGGVSGDPISVGDGGTAAGRHSTPWLAKVWSRISSASGTAVTVGPGRTSRSSRSARTPARRQWSHAKSSGSSAVGPQDAGSGGT